MLISQHEYVKHSKGNLEIYCIPCEYPKVADHIQGTKEFELSKLAVTFQKTVSKGIFVLVDNHEVIVGGALFDVSLSWKMLNDILIISDSASNIARYCDLNISKSAVALNLISSLPYYPFQNIPMWEGVNKIQPFCVLKYGVKQQLEEFKIWTPLELSNDVELTLQNIRERFFEVLRNHTGSYANLSTDLSGGVDSAAIAYALKAQNADIKLYHAKTDSKWNSDSEWAAIFANDMNESLNLLPSIGASGRRYETDMPYSELTLPDSPVFWADSEGYVEKIVNLTESYGDSVHFTGLGGDELFTPMPAYAWSVVRQNRMRSLSFGFQYCLLTRTPFLKGVSNLMNSMSFKEALKTEIDIGFDYAKSRRKESVLDWFGKITIPAWIAKDYHVPCYQIAMKTLNEISGGLDSDRSRHQALESLLFQRRVLSQLNVIYGNRLTWLSPFLDSEIIESALSIPMRYHSKSGITKPMLYQATKGIVPSEVFTRGFKGDYSTFLYKGYKESVKKNIHVVRDFKVVELGIVDPDILVSELSMPTALHDRIVAFERLSAVERWLNNAMSYQS
ncbi:asparagine synthase C-terminal domain-containing protein [Lysinibacillus xylanilyticus]|uniref:asparagine synthase C-terminal domain-containing protein n=1 Tax=Lysinibacillus xylanilyticus TaxID=582475 RepID=UPI002E249069|nr:asparagine synthase C-terminal domain-containing protein [Lysinibacillus xylanilyticus]